jgi:hypothetical protein
MAGYLDMIVYHVFFMQKTTLYQVPATTLSAFLVNFGFVFVAGLAGVFVAFFTLRRRKQSLLYLILFLSFFVPFALAESYIVGLYLPFQWFVYYMMPPMVILAAVACVFLLDQVSRFYTKNKNGIRKVWVKAAVVALVILVSSMFLFRFGTVYGKIMEAGVYYSTSDPKALDAGTWLNNTYPENATVVVTEIPGFWFRLFSGKTVIAATDPIIQRNEISASVLDLSYELEQPLTLVRAYEAKGAISDENYVSINHVWNRGSYSSGDGDFVSYRLNGTDKKVTLSSFSREIVFEDQNASPKRLLIRYVNNDVSVTQTIQVYNDSYPMDVSWTLSPLQSSISNVSLYLSVFFDLKYHFLKAYIPGVLNWENPWSHPSDSQGNEWAVTDFTNSTLSDKYIGFYDEQDDIAYALKFEELPDWGDVGALASMQIDALRFQYNFDQLSVNQNASFAYQVLTFSKDSYSAVPAQPIDVKSLFDLKPAASFELMSRDYRDYIKENNIEFIVYDKNQLDTKIIHCKLLQLVYSNDRYVIFKIKNF